MPDFTWQKFGIRRAIMCFTPKQVVFWNELQK